MSDQNEGNSNSGQNAFKVSIVASVIASLLVIFLIQPILVWFWNFISDAGNHYLASLVDRLYANASLGYRDWVSALTAICLLYLPLTYLAGRLGRSAGTKLREKIRESSSEKRGAVLIKLYFTLGLLVAFHTLITTVIASFIFTDLQLNASFNRRLAVLSPHLTTLQEKEIKASWALMESKADYLIIKSNMEALASGSNVKLPPPLLRN